MSKFLPAKDGLHYFL